jgi:hypothetical protein
MREFAVLGLRPLPAGIYAARFDARERLANTGGMARRREGPP